MLNAADSNFRSRLAERVSEDIFRPVTQAYLEEPRGRYHGKAEIIAAPRTTEEVSEILRLCQAENVGVVPYGGGTGLVGGQVMPDGPLPLILSLERMNKLRALHADENVMIADAGMTIAAAQEAAQGVGRLYPLSLASEGTCQIGGALATNAGGINVLRYGTARELCLGVEAVLADGSILNGLTRLRKDNTGYDLRDLIVGSEGTLGVITAASLRLFHPPAQVGAAIMEVPSPEAALTLLNLTRDLVGEGISAFELIHRHGLDFLADTTPEVRIPFRPGGNWMVLIELGLPAAADVQEILLELFDQALERGLVSDGVVSQSETQRQEFWNLREHIPEANKRIGAIASHDISLPLGEVATFIETAEQKVAAIASVRINCFGHLGDGNLHYNIFPPKGESRDAYAKIAPEITRVIYDLLADMGGSFSAEHGVGRLKTAELAKYGDAAKLNTMRAVKSALDPQGILNPGAVLANKS